MALVNHSSHRTLENFCSTAVAGMYSASALPGQFTYRHPVLVMYDWATTLAREVQLFWNGAARPLSAVLYFSNKYLNLLSQVLNMVALADASLSDEVRFSVP